MGDITSRIAKLRSRPIVVASHPRSGTHLTIDLIRRQFRPCRSWKWPGEMNNRFYVSLESFARPDAPGPMSEAKAVRVLRRVRRPLVKTHLARGQIEHGDEGCRLSAAWVDLILQRSDLVYVVRDPRSMMCSYHLYSKARDGSAECPIGEFMRQEVDGHNRARAWVEHVRSWMDDSAVQIIRFEDLLESTDAVVRRLAEGLALTPRWCEPRLPRRFRSIWTSRLTRAFGVWSGSTAIIGRPSGHRLERWPEAMTRDDRAFLHAEAGALMIELGYVDSEAWVEEGVTEGDVVSSGVIPVRR